MHICHWFTMWLKLIQTGKNWNFVNDVTSSHAVAILKIVMVHPWLSILVFKMITWVLMSKQWRDFRHHKRQVSKYYNDSYITNVSYMAPTTLSHYLQSGPPIYRIGWKWHSQQYCQSFRCTVEVAQQSDMHHCAHCAALQWVKCGI